MRSAGTICTKRLAESHRVGRVARRCRRTGHAPATTFSPTFCGLPDRPIRLDSGHGRGEGGGIGVLLPVPPLEVSGVRRMRWPFGRRERLVGLALSGGAVRGAAHCGVLAVIDEHDIPIDVIVGTSAGAMAGAAYASGMRPMEMMEELRKLSWPRLVRPVLPARRALFSTTPFTELLAARFGGATFADLDRPFVAVACDVLTGRRVLLTEGDVATAVQASMAIPGLFTPVEWGEHLLIDGGTVANYPAEVPRLFGATVVIGVNVGASPQPEPPGNPVDMLLAAAEIAARQGPRHRADVDIEPEVGEFSSFSFKAVPDLYERGRAAAEAALPAIEDLVGRR